MDELTLGGIVIDLRLEITRVSEYLLVEALIELVLDHLVDRVALEVLLVVGIGRI